MKLTYAVSVAVLSASVTIAAPAPMAPMPDYDLGMQDQYLREVRL